MNDIVRGDSCGVSHLVFVRAIQLQVYRSTGRYVLTSLIALLTIAVTVDYRI